MAYRNWAPVVESLFQHLIDTGATIIRTSDGSGWEPNTSTQQVVASVLDVDSAYVQVAWGEFNLLQSTLHLIYDEDPADVVNDYTYNSVEVVHLIEHALDQFSAEWENKPCPTTPAPAPAGEDQ